MTFEKIGTEQNGKKYLKRCFLTSIDLSM